MLSIVTDVFMLFEFASAPFGQDKFVFNFIALCGSRVYCLLY